MRSHDLSSFPCLISSWIMPCQKLVPWLGSLRSSKHFELPAIFNGRHFMFCKKMEGELSQKQKEQLGLGGAADVVQGVEGFYVHVQTTDASCNWADRANKAIQENIQLKDDVKELRDIVTDLVKRVDYLEHLVDKHNEGLYD